MFWIWFLIINAFAAGVLSIHAGTNRLPRKPANGYTVVAGVILIIAGVFAMVEIL